MKKPDGFLGGTKERGTGTGTVTGRKEVSHHDD
jgi:hypothetical protein